MTTVAVLGAGPHGREIASVLARQAKLYDDNLDGYEPLTAAEGMPYVIGAAWPKVRHSIFVAVPWVNELDGHVIFPGARVSPDAEFGSHVHVGYNAVVAHGCRLGGFVTVCPGAVLCGDVKVGFGAFVGAGAVVIHGGLRIGEFATIGAGAVVTENVPAGATVAGVPARRLPILTDDSAAWPVDRCPS